MRFPLAPQTGGVAPAPAVLFERARPTPAESPAGEKPRATPAYAHVEPSRQSLRQRVPKLAASEATQYQRIPDAVAAVRGVLVVVAGEPKGKVYAIKDGENVLGRDASCDVVIPPETISRRHAKLTHEDGVYWVEPLSERNKTVVNRDTELSEAHELHDDDLIRLASTTLRFRTIDGL
jgi:hypothetical protein